MNADNKPPWGFEEITEHVGRYVDDHTRFMAELFFLETGYLAPVYFPTAGYSYHTQGYVTKQWNKFLRRSATEAWELWHTAYGSQRQPLSQVLKLIAKRRREHRERLAKANETPEVLET